MMYALTAFVGFIAGFYLCLLLRSWAHANEEALAGIEKSEGGRDA